MRTLKFLPLFLILNFGLMVPVFAEHSCLQLLKTIYAPRPHLHKRALIIDRVRYLWNQTQLILWKIRYWPRQASFAAKGKRLTEVKRHLDTIEGLAQFQHETLAKISQLIVNKKLDQAQKIELQKLQGQMNETLLKIRLNLAIAEGDKQRQQIFEEVLAAKERSRQEIYNVEASMELEVDETGLTDVMRTAYATTDEEVSNYRAKLVRALKDWEHFSGHRLSDRPNFPGTTFQDEVYAVDLGAIDVETADQLMTFKSMRDLLAQQKLELEHLRSKNFGDEKDLKAKIRALEANIEGTKIFLERHSRKLQAWALSPSEQLALMKSLDVLTRSSPTRPEKMANLPGITFVPNHGLALEANKLDSYVVEKILAQAEVERNLVDKVNELSERHVTLLTTQDSDAQKSELLMDAIQKNKNEMTSTLGRLRDTSERFDNWLGQFKGE